MKFSKKRIILCVTNNLKTDQRVQKMAHSLSQYAKIQLVGRNFPKTADVSELNYNIKLFNLIFNRKFLFYAEFNLRLFFYLLFHSFDVATANDADTLPSVFWACRLKRKKMVFDSHEIFSEVPELFHRQKIKRFWQKIENYYIPKIENKITVSESIIDYYRKKYQTEFSLVRNLPIPIKHFKRLYLSDFNLPENKKIIIYQGALNIGRGLELAIRSLLFLPDNYIFVLAGKGDIQEQLFKQVKELSLDKRVFFMGQLSPYKLRQLTPLSDVGLSIEQDIGLNYRYALPNKLFDYIQAEVPIIVADLPEMSKIIKNNGLGLILRERTGQSLAQLIETLFLDKHFYSKIREQMKVASPKFIWSVDEKNLLNMYKNLIL